MIQYIRYQTRQGTKEKLLQATALLAEPALSTNTGNLFIGDSSSKFVPVQTLDMAVVDEDFNIMIDEDKSISYDF